MALGYCRRVDRGLRENSLFWPFVTFIMTTRRPYDRLMSENLRTVPAADGRTLAYAVWGDPDGHPIFSLHGTPGSRLNRHPDDSKVAAVGARVITYDRPGYGASSRHHGRAVVDCVAD